MDPTQLSSTSSEQVIFTLFTRMLKPKLLNASASPASSILWYSAIVS